MDKRSSVKRGLILLLSHHAPGRLDRCLRLSLGSRAVYFCARCTGIYAGLLFAYLVGDLIFPFVYPSGVVFMVGSFMASPAFVDWSTQTMGIRESKNRLRVMTGFISGCGMFLLLSLAASHLELVLVSVNLYIAGILSVHLLKGRKARSEM